MKYNFFLSFVLFFSSISLVHGQSTKTQVTQVLANYDRYKEPVIKTRLFKHSDVVALIQKHVDEGLLKSEVIGQSVEGRSINHLTLGKGKIKVLLWSQMHGDEATATMALFDLFNFLSAKDKFDNMKANLLSKLELHIVPMLNPDGAQAWKRTNAMKIDINRDAQNLATPEARALMDLAKKVNPAFGFNLHDQSTYYAAGKNTAHPATISFLAPAFNTPKDMNPVRTKAVQLIVTINNAIQNMIPNQVAKYNDTWDPRCFGDTFQGMGISTILIESGGYANDPQKQQIRKVNFYALLTALNAIADESYLQEDENTYWNLPNNNNNLYDVIVRNVNLPLDGKTTPTSLGINRLQKTTADFKEMYYVGTVAKTAKLDSNYAYKEIDATKLNYAPGKVKEMTKIEWEKLKSADEFELVKQGYLYVKWTDESTPVGPIANRWLNLASAEIDADVAVGKPANFILEANNKPAYAIINGYFVDLVEKGMPLLNTMGY